MLKILAVTIAAVIALAGPQQPQEPAPQVPFDAFLADLRVEAIAKGISQATIDAALTGLEPLAVVVTRDRAQPENTQSLDDYLKKRLTASRVSN